MTRTLALFRVQMEVASGAPPTMAGLEDRVRRALALATAVGAPVGASLRAAAAAAEDRAELGRAIHVATAQARLVAQGLVALPLVLVPALDLLLGLSLLGFYATAAGRLVGAVGLGLVSVGGLLASWMVRAVDRPPRRRAIPDDEVADLLAAAVRAGLPAPGALRAVGEVRPEIAGVLAEAALAMEHGRAAIPADARVADAVQVLAMAEQLGAPAAEALGALARQQRADERARVRARAEQLPGRLTVPSVLLLLPATVLLVGAPIVAAGLDLL